MWGSGDCGCGFSLLNGIDKDIDKVVCEASSVKCPNCEVPTILSSGCTHMKCQRCGTIFCYFCGIKINTVSLLDHNRNYRIDKSKCPIFLAGHPLILPKKDASSEEQNSVFIFYRTLRMLRALKEKYSEDEWRAATERNTNGVFTYFVLPDEYVKSPAPFNLKYALATDFPNPRNFECALP